MTRATSGGGCVRNDDFKWFYILFKSRISNILFSPIHSTSWYMITRYDIKLVKCRSQNYQKRPLCIGVILGKYPAEKVGELYTFLMFSAHFFSNIPTMMSTYFWYPNIPHIIFWRCCGWSSFLKWSFCYGIYSSCAVDCGICWLGVSNMWHPT